MVEELCRVAERLALPLRREPLEGAAGGLCRFRGQTMILLDAGLPADAQAYVLSAALAEAARSDPERFDLDAVFIRPEVRRFLEGYDADV